MPIAVLAGFELALRVCGYGYRTQFWIHHPMVAQDKLVENQRFDWRFVPRPLVRNPRVTVVDPKKPAGVYRIIIFGESAAMGDPDSNVGFGRIAEVMLRDRYPGAAFEVINTAFTAINSHVIRPIAKDCIPLGADLWLVYMGNNEPTGPFGAGTVYTQSTPPLPIIHANLALKSTRLGQLLDAARAKIMGGDSSPKAWAGMQMHIDHPVRENDPRLETVYRYFAANYDDILKAAARAGAKVIASTVVANLRDCPPLGSLHRADLSSEQKKESDKLYDSGVYAETNHHFEDAVDDYERALKIDDTFADLHFRLGRCQLELGKNAEAKLHFERARDLDTLRFRVDSRLNEIICRQTTNAGTGAVLLDSEKEFAKQTKDGIPGDEWLYEHVHMKFEGNFLLARLFADRIKPLLPQEIQAREKKGGDWLSPESCAEKLGFGNYSRFADIGNIYQRLLKPPFTRQIGHSLKIEHIRNELDRLFVNTKTMAVRRDIDLCRAAVTNAPGDWMLHDLLGYLFATGGETSRAEDEWKKVNELVPHHPRPYCEIGKLRERKGDLAAAIGLYRTALRADPDEPEAHFLLASALLRQGNKAEAAVHFRETLKSEPDRAEARKGLEQTGQAGK